MTSSADVNAVLPAAIPKLESPEIDYNVASFAHSQPRLVRILKEGGTQTATVGGSTEEIKFTIPAGTYNLAKSMLTYAADVENDATVTWYMWFKADILPIQEIRLTTQEGGYELTKLTFVDHYSRIVPKAETPLEKYLTNDRGDVIYPSLSATNNYPGPSNQAAVPNALDPRYWIVHHQALTVSQYKNIELSTFKNTLLALDKMVYYPEPLQLTVVFKDRNSWYHESKSNSRPDGADAGGADRRDAQQDIKLSDIALYMKQESDPTIDAECKAAVLHAPADQPFTLMVPVTTGRKMVGSAGNNGGFQINLSSAMGTRLQRVYAIPQDASESKHSRYLSTNSMGTRVRSFQTRFNSVNVQPHAVSSTGGEDYLHVRQLLKGSVFMGRDSYMRDWFILDDYSGITDDVESMYPPGKHNLVTGKKVNAGDIFELVTDNAVAVQWYVYIVGQRVLRIAPLGKGGISYV